VRIQTMPGFASTLREAWPKMVQNEGYGTFYKGLVPLWGRQIPYTMMKFACFEKTLELLYHYVVPKPRDQCTKGEQLVVTFAAGYIAGVFCAIVSHPADTVVSKLNQVRHVTLIHITSRNKYVY
ncbi:jg25067, partial [Pararge aegeria aegeria]